MDIFEQARRSINRSLIELYFNKEKAYWKNGEFWTLNPLRSDNKIGSFSISETGFYKDFAAGHNDYQGDFIDLVSKHFNLSSKESAEKIIKDSGGYIEDDNKYTPPPIQKKSVIKCYKLDKVKEIELRDQFKNKALEEYNTIDKDGNIFKPCKSYAYHEYKTDLFLFFIIRYECKELKESGKSYKKFHPFYYGENEKIIQKMPEGEKPYPLYNINLTIGNNLPVIIVEGEKCANIQIDNYILVTYAGGPNNIKYFDFEPLTKKEVYIWPDNDKQKYKEGHEKAGEIMPKENQPGYSAALKIKTEYLKHSKIFDIDILNKPEKWDIADAFSDGENIDELIKKLIKNTEVQKDVPPIDPYYAYKRFVSEIYGEKNLIQLDGIMWKYKELEHYWQQFKKENIQVDFQIWMEKSGAIELLDSLDKSKSAYRSQAITFVNGHGMEFYNDNFFKYSAVNPFIHFRNGAIEILEDGYEFYSREKHNEDFFRGLYPMNCFEYNYNESDQGKININNIKEKAPMFCHFIDSIIPDYAKNDIDEVEKTYKFIFQTIAYSMSPKKPGEYFFGFYGPQGSAKSSLFRLISLFIGDDFIVSRPSKDFMSNRFATSDLWNSKIYVDNDLTEGMPLPEDFIKQNSGENTISIEGKNQPLIKGVKLSITMFFISNYEFKATGTEGIDRRAIIVKFHNSIPESKRDRYIMDRISGKRKHDNKTPEFKDQIFDERPAILNLIMDSWNDFIDNNNSFIMPDWIKTSSDKIKSSMDSVGSFFYEIAEGENDNIDKEIIYTSKELYEKYKEWCIDEGRRPKGRNKFYESFERAKHSIYYVEKNRHTTQGWTYKITSKSKSFKKEYTDEDLANVF